MHSIGDKIKFLNEEGFGYIKAFDGDAIIVENEFGFTESYPKHQILVEDNSLNKIKVVELKDQSKQPKPKNVILKEKVVDLHFDHLVDYPKQYTAHEKLLIQLQTAKEEIAIAKKLKLKKLILIHGKGSGKLEFEILKILNNIPKIKHYDADFSRYKLGAVEITFL